MLKPDLQDSQPQLNRMIAKPLAKPFCISVLGVLCLALSACVNTPHPVNTDATHSINTPVAPAPDSVPATAPSAPRAATSEPEPVEEALEHSPFQDIEPLFASVQQAREYQDNLYRLLLGELGIARGHYHASTEQFLQVAQRSRQADIAERAARIALFSKDMLALEQAARLWLELAPDNIKARQVLTVALLRLEKSAQAAAQIEHILDTEGSSIGDSSETLVGLLKQSGNHTTALQVLDELLKRRPHDTHLLYLQARLLMGAEQIPAAVAQLEKLLALQPSHEDAVTLYVRLQHQQGNVPQVLDFLAKQLALFPQRDDWRLTYARLLISNAQVEQAQRQFEKLLADNPEDTELLYTLGLLSLQSEAPDIAKGYFQSLLARAKDAEQRNTARYFLAQSAEQAEQVVEALNWYRQIDQGQYYFNANNRIVLLHLKEGRFAQALADFQDIAPATPEEEFKLLQLEAEIYLQQKQYDKAFKVYQSGLERDPDNIDLLYMQGMIAEKMQRLDLLEARFRRILELEPNNIDTLNALGYTLADRTDRYEEALHLIQRAYQQRPDAFHILDSMGWVMYRLQRYDEAITFLRKAFNRQADPEIAAHLGEVLWHAGKQEEARILWETMNAKFPDHDILQKTMQKFLSNNH